MFSKDILWDKRVRIAVIGAIFGMGLAQVAVSGANASDVPTPAAAQAPASAAPVRSCRNADVTPTIIWQPDLLHDGYQRALIIVANSSRRLCRIMGWPNIALINAADRRVTVPTQKVAQPGTAVPIDLARGTSAFAGIKWAPCDKAENSCPTGNWLRFGLPGTTDMINAELEGFPDPSKSDITMRSLWIGTIQPSRQGVVNW